MSKRALLVLFVAMAAVLAVSGTALAKTYKIGVTVIVSHPALESDQKGFEKAIAEAGLEAEYDYQNAQGDLTDQVLNLAHESGLDPLPDVEGIPLKFLF